MEQEAREELWHDLMEKAGVEPEVDRIDESDFRTEIKRGL